MRKTGLTLNFFFFLHLVYHQRNQAGSSPAMEFMGFKTCLEFLVGYSILITAFVSDRHVSIAAYMKKSVTQILSTTLTYGI